MTTISNDWICGSELIFGGYGTFICVLDSSNNHFKHKYDFTCSKFKKLFGKYSYDFIESAIAARPHYNFEYMIKAVEILERRYLEHDIDFVNSEYYTTKFEIALYDKIGIVIRAEGL